MATLISVSELRTRFDIDGDIADERLELHVGSASRRLAKWVGSTGYSYAIANPSQDVTSDLKNAEAHLTMHYALLGLNAPLSVKGVTATAMSGEGKELRKYLTPKETSELATQFLEAAREMADLYIAALDDSGIEIVACED